MRNISLGLSREPQTKEQASSLLVIESKKKKLDTLKSLTLMTSSIIQSRAHFRRGLKLCERIQVSAVSCQCCITVCWTDVIFKIASIVIFPGLRWVLIELGAM